VRADQLDGARERLRGEEPQRHERRTHPLGGRRFERLRGQRGDEQPGVRLEVRAEVRAAGRDIAGRREDVRPRGHERVTP
jgi:hypothetical protein